MKKLIRNEVARRQLVFCFHFLRTHHDYFSQRGFESVWAKYLSGSTSKSSVTCNFPPNIRLDEDVFRLRLQKTSSSRLQDVLIKTNIFAIVIRLQKTSSRRLQEVLVKTNIFVLAIHPKDVFKKFSRRL